MRRIAVLDAPSNLGLRPPTASSVPGCAKAPGALRDHALLTRLGARDAGCITPARFDPAGWEPGDGVAQSEDLAIFTRRLADRIGSIIDAGDFPVVLGGDCSILLGAGLAMRRHGTAVGGRVGLVYVDGHSDFRHQGNASYVGAAGGEALALATGRGQANLAGIENRRPYFRDVDVVLLGIRTHDEYRLDLQAAGIQSRPVPEVRSDGAPRSAQWARQQLAGCAGYWVHVDVDVLDPAVMPAVDAPDAGGIAYTELEQLLQNLVDTPRCLGVQVTVFDPDYDPEAIYAREVADTLVAGLSPLVAAHEEEARTLLPLRELPLVARDPGVPAPRPAPSPRTPAESTYPTPSVWPAFAQPDNGSSRGDEGPGDLNRREFLDSGPDRLTRPSDGRFDSASGGLARPGDGRFDSASGGLARPGDGRFDSAPGGLARADGDVVESGRLDSGPGGLARADGSGRFEGGPGGLARLDDGPGGLARAEGDAVGHDSGTGGSARVDGLGRSARADDGDGRWAFLDSVPGRLARSHDDPVQLGPSGGLARPHDSQDGVDSASGEDDSFGLAGDDPLDGDSFAQPDEESFARADGGPLAGAESESPVQDDGDAFAGGNDDSFPQDDGDAFARGNDDSFPRSDGDPLARAEEDSLAGDRGEALVGADGDSFARSEQSLARGEGETLVRGEGGSFARGAADSFGPVDGVSFGPVEGGPVDFGGSDGQSKDAAPQGAGGGNDLDEDMYLADPDPDPDQDPDQDQDQDEDEDMFLAEPVPAVGQAIDGGSVAGDRGDRYPHGPVDDLMEKRLTG